MMLSACTRARLGLLISGILFAGSLGVLVHSSIADKVDTRVANANAAGGGAVAIALK